MDIFPIRRPPEDAAEALVPDLSDGAEAGLYLALFELVEEGLIITSDETILEVNSAACHLLDRSYPQLVGKPLADLFPSEAAYLAARAALFVDGAARGSLLLGMPDGERRHLRCLAAARVRPGVHALVLSPDTAGVPELAPRPLVRDEIWPRLAAAVQQPVLVIDGRRRISAANAAAQSQLGGRSGTLVGTELAALGLDLERTRRLPGPRPGWEVLILPRNEHSVPSPIRPADERQRRAFEHLPLPVLLCDADSLRIVEANAAAEAVYGQGRAALLALRLDDLIAVRPTGRDPRESGTWRHRRSDGSEFEVEIVATALPAAKGGAELLLMHAPQPRPTPLQRYSAELLAHCADGVMLVDATQRIVAVNPALCRISGFSRDSLLGAPAAKLLTSAQDNPFVTPELTRSGHWQDEIRIRGAGAKEVPVSLQISRIGGAAEAGAHSLVILRDHSEREQLRAEAAGLLDRLTGLPGRGALAACFAAQAGLARAARKQLALMVLDLDDFHRVNGELGEPIADEVLRALAERLRREVPTGAVVTRVGADSFLVMAAGVNGEAAARALAGRLLDACSAPLTTASGCLSPAASIGVALQPDHGESLAELLGAAESALAEARAGGDPLRFFDPAQHERTLLHTSLDAALRRAPERGELTLHWQPRFRLRDGRLIAAEALLRWNHPQLGMLEAERFVPGAIRSGAITALGAWALARACEQMAAWREAYGCELVVAVNVSLAELLQADFVDRLKQGLAEHALPAAALELELGDCAGLASDARAMSTLYALQEAGVGLRIDRFGSASAPLAVLRQLPVGGLKIDPVFVRDLLLCDEGLILVNAMLATANGLGLDVVAAGVEHTRQRELLAANGCHAGQGRLHGLPISSEAFGHLLAAATSKN